MKFRNFLAREFKKYRRGREKKGKKKTKGYRTRRKDLTWQFRHVSMPLGGVHGMWSHQPSVPSPPFTSLSPFLTHTHTPIQTSECLYPCRSCFLFVYPYIPLPIRARFTRCREWSPRTSNRPWPFSLSTLVINTNCSIQTFKMCLTFLWHVIPSSPRSFSKLFFLLSISLSSYISLYIMLHRTVSPLLSSLSAVWQL